MSQVNEAQTVLKTPAGKWDITINWACPTRDLGNDIIEQSDWAVTGPDSALTLSDESIDEDGKTTTVWMEAGTSGGYYQVTNTVTTQDGRVLVGTFVVQVVPYVYFQQPRCF